MRVFIRVPVLSSLQWITNEMKNKIRENLIINIKEMSNLTKRSYKLEINRNYTGAAKYNFQKIPLQLIRMSKISFMIFHQISI